MINVVKVKCSKATVESLRTLQLKDRLHKSHVHEYTKGPDHSVTFTCM